MTIHTVYTAEQIALMTFIENENQSFREKTKDKSNAMFLLTVSDPLHWATYDIHTIAEYNHYSVQSEHYDLYKEVVGVRPSWFNYSEMSIKQIQDEIDILYKDIEDEIKIEAEIKKAEDKEHQERKRNNSYKKNLVFAGLKDAILAA
jgi:hypothetical protein